MARLNSYEIEVLEMLAGKPSAKSFAGALLLRGPQSQQG